MSDERTRTVSQLMEGDVSGDARELPRVIVAFECRRPFSLPVRLALTDIDEFVIGRGTERQWQREGSRLELKVPDQDVSRQHAVITRHPEGCELRDLGSKNGTTVNGVTAVRTVLADGDLIEVGGVVLVFRDDGGNAQEVADLDLETMSTLPTALRTTTLEMEASVAELAKIALSSVPVLIRGDTGTGKEVAAQAVHELSGRRGAFVPVNCGALPRALIESELFGYKRGAFSGARDDREGLVRRADGGTLFLDEIADLPEESQVALLRVLQEGEVRPIGSPGAIHVDVRIVAATHQDLEERIADGRFRRDLYARLLGHVVWMPPLSRRREDIGMIMAALLQRESSSPRPTSIQRYAARALFSYPFPLNVRELEQALRRAAALAQGGELRKEHLPETIRNYRPNKLLPEEQALRDQLAELLRKHRGNIAAVGRALGKAPIQIRRWCARFSLQIAPFRD